MRFKTFDENQLRDNFSGDEDILIDLITEFQAKSDDLILAVDKAIQTKVGSELKITAHTLKGVISNFYAEEIRLIAYDLEKAGSANNFDQSTEKLDLVKIKMVEFKKELDVFKATLT